MPGLILSPSSGAAASSASGARITGTPAVGETLTAVLPTGVTGTVQWLRAGVAIAGAVSTTYVLQSADLGTELSYRFTPTAYSAGAGVTVITSTPVLVDRAGNTVTDRAGNPIAVR